MDTVLQQLLISGNVSKDKVVLKTFSAAPPCVDSIVVKTPHVHRFTAFAKHCNFLKKQNKKTSIVYGKMKYFYNSV